MILSKLLFLALACGVAAIGSEFGGSPTLPFSFVENRGQTASAVQFTGEGPGFKAWFQAGSVVFQQGSASTRMSFAGASRNARYVAESPTGASANYFHGQDADQWVRDLRMYGSLRYQSVWKGIDADFRADASRLKTEYIVSPGARVSDIRLVFDGTVRIEEGSLVVAGQGGEYREAPPIIYQGDESDPLPVKGSYELNPDGSVGFRVGSYDTRRPLVIDPLIVFSGYFGGSAQSTITAVAVNSYYNVVVAGWTMSTNLPAAGEFESKYNGGVDAFVATFSPAGGQLLYCTYLGGSGDDRAFALAVDSSNNTYITGWSSSGNFPVLNAYQKKLGGTRDAFVTKLNAQGNAIAFSTYLGGSGVDVGYGIVLDSTFAPVITGDTTSSNLPVTSGAFQSTLAGPQNAFVAKLSPSGGTLTLMTYFGGGGTDHAATVKVDTSNAIFLGGSTYSTNFPVLNAFQPSPGGGQDGFISKLSADGRTLIFSSYYGGSNGSPGVPEAVNSIVISADTGNVNIGGVTSSPDFPTTPGCLQPAFGGGQTDGFLGRVNGTTGALLISTYVGGSADDSINAVDTDSLHDIYAAGYTSSSDFPALNAIQNANAGGLDAFVYKTNLVSEEWGTYLGGSGNDSANAIAVDSLTNVVVAGSTGSSKIPVAGNLAAHPGSQLTSFITKIAPFTAALMSPPVLIEDIWHNTGYNGPNLTLFTSIFGLAGDIPVAGDWTGTGVKRLGTFRNGVWYLDINGNGSFDSGDKTVTFGQAGDIPVVGDWNGTGKIKLGLFRNGTFILDLSGHLSGVSTGLSDATFSFGQAGDVPVAADWNQSGTTKVGVFRNGLWLVDLTGSRTYSSAQTYTFGQTGDTPVVGDWDGSGAPHLGVYRQGLWILDYLGNFALRSPLPTYNLVFAFGGVGYLPLIM